MQSENAHMQLIALAALNIEKGENEIIRSIGDARPCVSVPSLWLGTQIQIQVQVKVQVQVRVKVQIQIQIQIASAMLDRARPGHLSDLLGTINPEEACNVH